MYPSFGSARFDSVLTRVFKEKARLGSLTFPKNSVYRKRPKRVDFRLWRQAYIYMCSLNHSIYQNWSSVSNSLILNHILNLVAGHQPADRKGDSMSIFSNWFIGLSIWQLFLKALFHYNSTKSSERASWTVWYILFVSSQDTLFLNKAVRSVLYLH